MKKRRLHFGEGFRVVRGNRRSQAAEMVLAPGDAEGAADNRHRGASATPGALLRTLNFYVPPAYRRDGNPLPRGRK